MKKIVLTSMVYFLFSSVVADQAVITNSANTETSLVQTPESRECQFSGVYVGLGVGGVFYRNKHEEMKSQNVNRFVGTMFLGAGKVLKDAFYLGLEGMVDFSKPRNKAVYDSDGDLTQAKTRCCGITPSIGARFGYVKNTWMLYGKVSASHASFEIWDTRNGRKEPINKFSPSLALGIEKGFRNKFSARLEGEYRFPSKKNDDMGKELRVNQGFTVRALATYNIR